MLLSACSDDNTVFNEPSPIRAYETDAEILAQFVDVDNATGAFFINPDKKITASDYVVNRSREELMMVNSVNRDKFTRDMEDVNGVLRMVKQSGISTAIIYSTYFSDKLIEGSTNGTFEIERLAPQSKGGSTLAQMVVTSEGSDARQFYAPLYMTMNLSANSAMVCMALVWAYLVGEHKDINIKPIRILKHGRKAKSLVKYGLEEISTILMRPTYTPKFDVFKFLSCT